MLAGMNALLALAPTRAGTGVLVALALAGGVAEAGELIYGNDKSAGARQYNVACAQCHGIDGKGRTALEVSEELKVPIPKVDLTRIKIRYGRFPREYLFHVIAGDGQGGEGHSVMPHWQDVFEGETEGGEAGRRLAAARITQIIDYIQSFQVEEGPEVITPE